MKIILVILTISASFVFLPPNGYSQSISDSITASIKDSTIGKSDSSSNQTDRLLVADKVNRKSYFLLGINYINDNVYLGRKDSTAINYYTPTVAYYHKSGFYAQFSMGYLLNSFESRVDLFTFEAGYEFIKGNYDGAFSATKFFYNSQSTNVNAEIKSSLSYSNGYDFGFIRPSLEGTLNLGSKADIAVGFGTEHSFDAFDEALEIIPKILVNAGTQNFYNDYYRKRRYTIKRKGQKPTPGVAAIVGEVVDPNKFKVLDYEASMELNYTVGKWTFNFLPTYAIPVNPSTINIAATLQNGTVIKRTKTEELSNTFYWNLGFTVKL